MDYKIKITNLASEHLAYFQKTGQKNILRKIELLLSDIKIHPFEGLGKPEALKYELTGSWSGRINSRHRVVYEVEGNIVYIIALRGHYK